MVVSTTRASAWRCSFASSCVAALVAASTALVLSGTETAHAAGLYQPGPGVKAIGRAGAVVAGSNDGRSHWYNPANLANIKGTQFLLDITAVNGDLSYTPSNPAQIAPLSPATAVNDGGPFTTFSLERTIPSMAISTDFSFAGQPGLVLSGAVYSPYAVDFQYEPVNPQRWAMIDSNLLQVNYGLALAYRTSYGLRVGGEITLVQVKSQQRLAISSAPAPLGAFQVGNDALSEISSDDFTVSGVLGVGYELPVFEKGSPWLLDVAFSARLPVSSIGEGFLASQVPGVGTDQLYFGYCDPSLSAAERDACIKEINDDATKGSNSAPMTLQVDLPTILSTGVRFAHREWFEVEFDFVWEQWSRLQQVTVVPEEGWSVFLPQDSGTEPLAIPQIADKRFYQNTYAFRLGGEGVAVPGIMRVRAGVAYETGAIPDEWFNIGRFDRDKWIFGVGTTLTAAMFDFDLGFSYVLQQDFTVTNGRYEQINFIDTPATAPIDKRGQIVNNGDYSTSAWMLGLGVVVHLDHFWNPPGKGAVTGEEAASAAAADAASGAASEAAVEAAGEGDAGKKTE